MVHLLRSGRGCFLKRAAMWKYIALLFPLLTPVCGYWSSPFYIKCRNLPGSAYVNDWCYVVTEELQTVSAIDWKTHPHCKHMNGYPGFMASINTKELLDELLRQKIINNDERYAIGARQEPLDTDQCGGFLCEPEKHSKNWFFFDDKGKKLEKVNEDLWLVNEPNNLGNAPPEHVVALERFDRYKLGFNDVTAGLQKYKVLCQYSQLQRRLLKMDNSTLLRVAGFAHPQKFKLNGLGNFENIIKCRDGYTLIKETCYKVFKEKRTAPDAIATCKKDSGKLAIINDAQLNYFLTVLARNLTGTPDVRFGLTYRGKWVNEEGSAQTYFNFYKFNACGTAHLKGGYYAVLIAGPRDEPEASYWELPAGSVPYPFVCETFPLATQ